MFSQTLGTALGDWTADTAGLGYTGAAVVFGGCSRWSWQPTTGQACPHAAVLGGVHPDPPAGCRGRGFLDKPLSAGGLALSRYSASAALLAFMLTAILLFRQRAARTALNND
jgi:uncharacterized membrane-anchored protein